MVPRGVSIEGGKDKPPDKPSIDFAINFEFGSAKLTPDGRITIDNLGEALRDPGLRGSSFRIAGHTDAVGSDASNLELSKQRAKAVADYLAQSNSIAPSRLKMEGLGRSQLLDTANPNSAINRRVQVINLGEAQ